MTSTLILLPQLFVWVFRGKTFVFIVIPFLSKRDSGQEVTPTLPDREWGRGDVFLHPPIRGPDQSPPCKGYHE